MGGVGGGGEFIIFMDYEKRWKKKDDFPWESVVAGVQEMGRT